MGLMVFVEGQRFGTGSVFGSKRPKGSLVVDYEYVWDGQHVVGSFTGTRTATKTGPGPWRRTWTDVTPGGATVWTGTAVLLEAQWGKTRILTGEWGMNRQTPKHAWLLVL